MRTEILIASCRAARRTPVKRGTRREPSLQLTRLLPIAALLLCASARGQESTPSRLELYGLLSAGLVSGTGFTIADERVTAMSEQGQRSSRWGIRGSEVLGGGLKATFTLESSLSVRSGAAGRDAGGTAMQVDGSLFDREANIALISHDRGSLRVGRGKNLLYDIADEFDARGNANFGALKSVARYAGFYGSGVSRFDNMLRYSAPGIAGVQVDAAYSMGGVPGDASASSSYVAGLRYERDAFELAYAHGELKVGDAQLTTNQRIDLIAAKTLMGRFTLNIGFARTRNPSGGGFQSITPSAIVDGRTSANTWFTGVRYRWSERMAFTAGYYDVSDRVTTDRRNDVRMLGLGVLHAFSKRTELYIDIARAWREDNADAPFTIFDRFRSDRRTPSESAVSQTALNIGIQHRF